MCLVSADDADIDAASLEHLESKKAAVSASLAQLAEQDAMYTRFIGEAEAYRAEVHVLRLSTASPPQRPCGSNHCFYR